MRRSLDSWQSWAAVRQARRLRSPQPPGVRICWDLDNTLVGSGTLLHEGKRLEDAIIQAAPMPNMLAFFVELAERLPRAEHFILSVRTRSMRVDTLAWLRRNALTVPTRMICFVPRPEVKTRVWEELARDSKLVIVDDLSYAHASDEPSIYDALVAAARRTAAVYVGLDEIVEIASSSYAPAAVASRVVSALEGS